MQIQLQRRNVDLDLVRQIQEASPHLNSTELRLLASRGATPYNKNLAEMLGNNLKDQERGAKRIAHAIHKKEPIVVVADYDCDGATSCAVMVAGLRALGADIQFVVPDRLVHGYGISPSVVDMARDRYPKVRLIVTVDNGILGHAGIEYATNLGLDVVVTDHHLPGEFIPSFAYAVINPSRKDCAAGLQKLAGVGVALWVVIETKRQLASKGINTPKLNFLLPYVAIGTVADMVPMDQHNRLLVSVGLDLMRQGLVTPGVAALLKEAGTNPSYITTQDIGFGIAPRINAAGRLDTMDAGIELLLSNDPKEASKLARILTDTNVERKRLQKEATAEASLNLDGISSEGRYSIVKGSTDWHPGIVGLVASRLKDTHFRPTFIFAITDDYAKGSGRSIPGFHLKDAMEEVARRYPGVLAQFGGHAMAAGATLTGPRAVEPFAEALEVVARERIQPHMFNNLVLSDGPKPDFDLDGVARMLRHPWGQHFEAPSFDDAAVIHNVAPLGQSGQHWKIKAKIGESKETTEVVLFNQDEPVVGQEIHLFTEPALNTWQGRTNVQWIGKVLST